MSCYPYSTKNEKPIEPFVPDPNWDPSEDPDWELDPEFDPNDPELFPGEVEVESEEES